MSATPLAESKLSIIGCGNRNRSDDGVGPFVIEQLRERIDTQRQDIALFDAGTAGMEVMFQARGSSRLIIIDACTGNNVPGSLFKVPGDELQQAWQHEANLHSFRWQHALYAGHKIFGAAFPRDIDVYLIEAKSLALGLELSADAETGAGKLIAILENEINAFGRPQHKVQVA